MFDEVVSTDTLQAVVLIAAGLRIAVHDSIQGVSVGRVLSRLHIRL